ncbi:MAG TPA: class I SAM-dependent methyltransferase [Candidatus Aminicenantes bacterium]|nr:class I SAM-dependent methyltransferase [Candidatus Aminicenantes bacterium]
MPRKLTFVLAPALVVLAAGIGLLLTTRGSPPASRVGGSPGTPAPAFVKGRIMVRNLTKQRMRYTIGPVGFRKKPEKKILMPGDFDRRSTKTGLLLIYERLGAEIKEVLIPGHSYCFRPDGNNLARLYPGSHMREDAEDLAPYVSTPAVVVDKMLEMARLNAADMLYDLGCGDGRVVISAAKNYGARGVGIDIDPRRIKEAEAMAREAGVRGLVRFKVEDAMKTDFSEATVVTVYLLPESNALLKPVLEERLKPGARVVSHDYPFSGWEDKLLDKAELQDAAGGEHAVFLYRR